MNNLPLRGNVLKLGPWTMDGGQWTLDAKQWPMDGV